MGEPLKNDDFLDNWIKTQAFRYAFNEKTRGFIGKKFIRERITNTIPREFIARGLTKDKVGFRLTEMLANDLTQSLIRDCDEKRIKANEAEASASRNIIEKDVEVIGDKGVSVTSAPIIPNKPSTSYIPLIPSNSGAGHGSGGTNGKTTGVITSIPGSLFVGFAGSGVSGTPINIAGVGSGGVASARVPGIGNSDPTQGEIGTKGGTIASGSQLGGSFDNGFGFTAPNSGMEKGKKPAVITVENDPEGGKRGGIAIPAADGAKFKPVPPSPELSVSDVDRAIADFVAARLPNKSFEVRPKASSKPAVADNSKDIFSRGGSSSPARSGSPVSSIAPPATPSLPSDSEVPSLPFKLQHRILTTLQSTLEGAYYDFARKHYPTFLARKGWDCPEAGELTHWTRGLTFEFRQNPTKAIREAENFLSVLKGTDEIRHSAVHRVPVPGKDIQRLIESSRVVINMLDDSKRMREINEINTAIERNIQVVLDQRRKKEEKLKVELEKLEEWKRILELREMRAIKQAEHEEERIQMLFCDEVRRALDLLGTEERVGFGTGTDVESVGSSNKDGEPVHPTSRVQYATEYLASEQQEEEYFHESEGWPVGVDVNDDSSHE